MIGDENLHRKTRTGFDKKNNHSFSIVGTKGNIIGKYEKKKN